MSFCRGRCRWRKLGHTLMAEARINFQGSALRRRCVLQSGAAQPDERLSARRSLPSEKEKETNRSITLNEPAQPAGQSPFCISITSTDDSEPWIGSSAVRTDEGKSRAWQNKAVYAMDKASAQGQLCCWLKGDRSGPRDAPRCRALLQSRAWEQTPLRARQTPATARLGPCRSATGGAPMPVGWAGRREHSEAGRP